MELSDILAKLNHAISLIDADADVRVIRAELDDIRFALKRRERDMQPFPLMCECELRKTPQAHKNTSHKIAEQAYFNYARWHNARGTGETLERIEERGGFGCVEIRLLLKGLDPTKVDKKKREVFAKENPEIKL